MLPLEVLIDTLLLADWILSAVTEVTDPHIRSAPSEVNTWLTLPRESAAVWPLVLPYIILPLVRSASFASVTLLSVI